MRCVRAARQLCAGACAPISSSVVSHLGPDLGPDSACLYLVLAPPSLRGLQVDFGIDEMNHMVTNKVPGTDDSAKYVYDRNEDGSYTWSECTGKVSPGGRGGCSRYACRPRV